MSRIGTKIQETFMAVKFRDKEIFKPLNTGKIDEHVSCVREYIANIFFYSKKGKTIMIDAGYHYQRLEEKMQWLNIDPKSINTILITHQDTDHVGALEKDAKRLFDDATIYIGEIENRYLTAEVRRKVYGGWYKLPLVKIDNKKILLKDGQIFYIEDIKIECFLVPGHTWGHLCYLIDDKYLFTGDTIWFGPDGGYSFLDALAEDNELAKKSLAEFEKKLKLRKLNPIIITGHTGWYDDLEWGFRHKDQVCIATKKQKPHDPNAPYDGYDESADTRENARNKLLAKVDPVIP